MNEFFEISKTIANEFIQNIVFIDDEAFSTEGDKDHDFNPMEVTKAFVESQKICSIYNPVIDTDIANLINVAKKADIVILDWKIDLKKEMISNTEEETDEENDDPRGQYTLQIIRGILLEPINIGIKLIIVYTGETDLWQITKDIFNSLKADVNDLEQKDFEVSTNDYRILVIGKTSLNAKHIKEIQERIKSYAELPGFILNEFTNMTSGLLSNVALKSISVIRANTSRLLSTFNKKLDPAFLAHKSLLPNPEDASEQILDIIGSDIKSLIKSSDTATSVSTDSINEFIDAHIEDNIKVVIDEKDKFNVIDIPDIITRNNLKIIVKEGIERFFIKKTDPQEEVVLFSKNCHKSLVKWFTNEDESEKINIEYAKLTTLKSFYNLNYIPILSPGTVLITDDAKSEFWLCIQPKCDTVRISTKKRDFLLLRLINSSPNNFDIVIDENTFLRIDYAVFNSKLIGFKTSANATVSAIISADGKKKFERQDNLRMTWAAELKSDYAQSIVNSFASDLARVGMDHSEWLRRSSR